MKRTRGDSLTGGSGDVNPQTMVMQALQPGADQTGTQASALPIPRLPIRRGKSIVMELLGVQFLATTTPATAASYRMAVLTTNPNAFTTLTNICADPRVLANWLQWTVVGGTSGIAYVDQSKYVSLTDDAGHGILVATDQMYLFSYSAGTGVANEFVARVEYRFKEVSLEEYIGIVQSQQG